MTQTVPIEELRQHCPSIYKLVVLAAKRAKEVSQGAPKLIQGDWKKATSIALEEIRQGKVVYQSTEAEEAPAPSKTRKRAAKKNEKPKKS